MKVRHEAIATMLRKIWHDPVWSKVIVGVVLSIGAATVAYFLDWWPRIIQSLTAAPRFLGQRTSVPNWLLGSLVL